MQREAYKALNDDFKIIQSRKKQRGDSPEPVLVNMSFFVIHCDELFKSIGSVNERFCSTFSSTFRNIDKVLSSDIFVFHNCDYKTGWNSDVKVHIRHVHTRGGENCCDKCDLETG